MVKSLRGEGGALQRDGRVQPGMVLVRVSGVDVSAMPHAEVARLLEDTSGEGFRSLRFRSQARHQALLRCVALLEMVSPFGPVTQRPTPQSPPEWALADLHCWSPDRDSGVCRRKECVGRIHLGHR